jgi:sugar-specific transcriptional regulator TrmB
MNKEYIEKMVKLGISEREARVYTALITKRELTALEIHELTHVPRTKIYEIIQRLNHHGMCIEKRMGRKKKYQAVAPRRALGNLIRDYENDLGEKKRLAKDITEMIHPIYSQGVQIEDVTEYVEIVKGLPSTHERYVNLMKNTKKELLGFVKGPYAHQAKSQKIGEQERAEFEILKRGVVARVLYEFPSEEEIEWLFNHIKKCIDVGEEARVTEQIPVKMCVFDMRYVLMSLENPKLSISPFTNLVIDHPGLARAVRFSFDYLWEKGKDYKSLSKGRVKVET